MSSTLSNYTTTRPWSPTNDTGTDDDDDDDGGFFSFDNPTFRNIFFGVLGVLVVVVSFVGKLYYRKKHQSRDNPAPAAAAASNGGVTPLAQPSWGSAAAPPPLAGSQGLATVPQGSSAGFNASNYSNNNFLSNYNTYSTAYSYSDVAKT